jgi:hypothetical protein
LGDLDGILTRAATTPPLEGHLLDLSPRQKVAPPIVAVKSLAYDKEKGSAPKALPCCHCWRAVRLHRCSRARCCRLFRLTTKGVCR